MPMVDLLNSGYGLLGTMPKPFAERIAKVLDHPASPTAWPRHLV